MERECLVHCDRQFDFGIIAYLIILVCVKSNQPATTMFPDNFNHAPLGHSPINFILDRRTGDISAILSQVSQSVLALTAN
jgi:hypothetical protein